MENKQNIPEYKATPLVYAVHRSEQNPVFGETITRVRLDDEAGGGFIVLEQTDSDAVIRLDIEELEVILNTAKDLLKNYEAQHEELKW